MKLSGVFLVFVVMSDHSILSQEDEEVARVEPDRRRVVNDVNVGEIILSARYRVLAFEREYPFGFEYAVKFRERVFVPIPKIRDAREPIEATSDFTRRLSFRISGEKRRVE